MKKAFQKGEWESVIDIRDFLYHNLIPYSGGAEFLKGPSIKTKKLWEICQALLKKERDKGGVLDIDVSTISTVISHKPGYIKKDLEIVVGLQTDQPFKRAIKPFGKIRMEKKLPKLYRRSVI